MVYNWRFLQLDFWSFLGMCLFWALLTVSLTLVTGLKEKRKKKKEETNRSD